MSGLLVLDGFFGILCGWFVGCLFCGVGVRGGFRVVFFYIFFFVVLGFFRSGLVGFCAL